jgi:hypothetical protein
LLGFFNKMAGHPVVFFILSKLGIFDLATLLGDRAAGMETAAGRWIGWAGNISHQDNPFPVTFSGRIV